MGKKSILRGLTWLVFLWPAPLAAEVVPPQETEESRPIVRVGVVTDGPWVQNVSLREMTIRQVTEVSQRQFDVRFPEDKMLEADWTVDGVQAALDRLMDDPQVDLVITWGLIGSDLACRRETFSKTVIAPVVVDVTLQNVPHRVEPDGTVVSGVENLNYVTWPSQIDEDIDLFHQLKPFQHLAILVNAAVLAANVDISTNMVDGVRRQVPDARVSLVPVGTDVPAALAQLPPDVDAVYVAPLLQLTERQALALSDGLLARRLASFSLLGRSEVERGLLASNSQDADFDRISRRIALNIHRILRGERAAGLPVGFERGRRLTINMATAREVDVYPSWALLTEADLIHQERTDLARSLTLVGAVQEAVDANLDLSAFERSVQAGQQNVELARSVWRPQIDVSANTFVIDQDRAQGSFGSQGRWNASGTSALSQLLFSESASANLAIQGHLQEALRQQQQQHRLDIMLEASRAYLNVLRAKTMERIDRDNLRLTREHLDLSRSRQRLGAGHPSEVYRWESEIAISRRRVIQSQAQRNQTEIALNRLLHRPLEESFETRETDLDDPELHTSFERISPYINDPWSFRVFRDFLVQEGLHLSPELGRLRASTAAQRRKLVSARRAYWAPTVGASAELSGRTKAGGELPAEFSLGELLPGVGNIDWTLALSASFPVFSGGAKQAEVTQAMEDLARLEVELESLAESVEERIRNALHATGASFASIQLARDAAAASQRNLDLVTDAYRRGALSIQDLLDAQNASFVADQTASNAVFDHLVDFMGVQRAIGRYTFFLTVQERSEFLERLRVYYERKRSNRSRP